MFWFFIALLIIVAVVMAGRAHSRNLDRLENLLTNSSLSNPNGRDSVKRQWVECCFCRLVERVRRKALCL